ncbi:MAG: hypothetical protein ACRELG_00435, partial [Gemmataceae bacterium]
VGWGSKDAMEWIVFFFMPIIPIKAVHTFEWNGNQYQAIPIKWSFGLMVRTFLGRWLWGLGGLGTLLLVFGVIDILNQRSQGLGLLVAAVPFLGLGILLFVVLRWTDARNKAIRRVLGANTIGNCDPAHLPTDTLEKIAGEPRLAHGADTFADAAHAYFRQRCYARAMWAARVCVALEDQAEGESLTDMILEDSDVIAALEEVRRDAQRWQPLMFTSEAEPSPQTPDTPVDVLPAEPDDRIRPS